MSFRTNKMLHNKRTPEISKSFNPWPKKTGYLYFVAFEWKYLCIYIFEPNLTLLSLLSWPTQQHFLTDENSTLSLKNVKETSKRIIIIIITFIPSFLTVIQNKHITMSTISHIYLEQGESANLIATRSKEIVKN